MGQQLPRNVTVQLSYDLYLKLQVIAKGYGVKRGTFVRNMLERIEARDLYNSIMGEE